MAGLAMATLALAGCAPKLKRSGKLWVDGLEYKPDTCHVLTDRTGIQLVDVTGVRLELALPPARLDFMSEISGTPHVTYVGGPAKPMLDLGTCGTLTMRGEGYHGSGRRAASGRMSLVCSGAASVSGELTFEGCF